MNEKFKKSDSLNEPDDIMLMDDDDFSKAYDIDVLINQKACFYIQILIFDSVFNTCKQKSDEGKN